MSSVYVRAAKVVQANGGEPISDGVVVASGRTLAYVGPASQAPEPEPDAIVLDAGYVVPGLINAHVHLSMSELDTKRPSTELPGTEVERCISALARAQACLTAGITTVRDLGSPDPGIFSLRTAINDGIVTGARIFSAGRLLCCTGGHAYRLGHEADGADGLRRAARAEIRAGADFVKIVADGASSDPEAPIEQGAPHLTEDELSAAIDAAHALGKRVTAHALGRITISTVLRLGVDALEHAYALDDDHVSVMSQRGTFLVPTMLVYESTLRHGEETGQHVWWVDQLRRVRELSRRGVRQAISKGVRVAAGTDGGSPWNPHHNLVAEMLLLEELGMSRLQAIEAATRVGAELLGQPALGTLEEGKTADLVVLDSDPLEDLNALRRPTAVIKDGRVVVKEQRILLSENDANQLAA